MLIQQAAIAFERWTGVGGMADVMRTAVAPLLADATVTGLTDARPVSQPGAIYTVGRNYDGPGVAPRPERPLIYGKAPSSVAGHGDVADLGSVAHPERRRRGRARCRDRASGGGVDRATRSSTTSRRATTWLDGDQWLLGKSMPGFCPVGPVVVTAGRVRPDRPRASAARSTATPIQDGRTADMRFSIAEVIAYLSRHVRLETGRPDRDRDARHAWPTPPGPDRHLQAG